MREKIIKKSNIFMTSRFWKITPKTLGLFSKALRFAMLKFALLLLLSLLSKAFGNTEFVVSAQRQIELAVPVFSLKTVVTAGKEI